MTRNNAFKLLIGSFIFVGVLVAGGTSGCGYSSKDNEVTGQVKRILHQTPVLCPDRYDVDVSMGVMRNGTGSPSKEDLWLTITGDDVEAFKKAAADASIVRIVYSIKRFVICGEQHVADSISDIPQQ